MTREELRKEATTTVEWECTPMIDRPTFINGYITSAEPREKRIEELKAQIKKMKCCENCGWYYLQQHWRESEEMNKSRMFYCGTCGNKKNWKLRR